MPVLLGKGAFRIGGLGAAPAVPPAKPTGLVAYGSQGGAYVSWSPSAGASTYDVQGSNDNSSWSDVNLAQANATCADSTGYTFYRVRAHNAAGTSAYTSPAAAACPLSNAIFWGRSVHGFSAGTWSDLSGNGHDATQATSGHQFSLATNVLGGKSVVRSSDANRVMDLPNVMPTTGSFTKAIMFKLATVAAANNILTGTAGDSATVCQINNGDLVSGTITGGNNLVTSGEPIPNPQTAWALAVLTCFHSVNTRTGSDTWQQAWYLDGSCVAFSKEFQQDHPTIANISVGGLQGLAGFGVIGDMTEILLTGSVPTAAEMNNLANMVNATFALSKPTFNKQILFVGDSISTGAVASDSGGSWASLVALNNPRVYCVNKGRSGAVTADLNGDASSNLYPYTSCGVPTTCVVWAGTNDVDFGGYSGAQAYAQIQTLCQNLRSNGASKIVVVTMLPRDGDGQSGRISTTRYVQTTRLQMRWPTSRHSLWGRLAQTVQQATTTQTEFTQTIQGMRIFMG